MQLGWWVSGLGGKLERHDFLSPWSIVHRMNIKLERQNSLSSWSLVHRTNTETGRIRFSFSMGV
jgi:hypothetical protein